MLTIFKFPRHMQEAEPYSIRQEKERIKQSWDFQQEYMLQMMSDALSWKCSSEQYNCLVRDYYIARQKHQKEVMRLNQILYNSENVPVQGYAGSSIPSSRDQAMTDRIPLHSNNACTPQEMILGDSVQNVCKKRGREDEWCHHSSKK